MQSTPADTSELLARKVFTWTALYAVLFAGVVYLTMFR